MNSIFKINFSIARSNPLIARQVEIEENYTLKELSDLAMITLGEEPGDVEITGEAGTLDQCASLMDGFKENHSLVFTYSDRKKSTEKLSVFVDLVEICGQAEQANNGKRTLPKLTSAAGYNLPAGLKEIGLLNRIVRTNGINAAVQLRDGSIFSPKGLKVNDRKVERMIRIHFDPDSGEKTINMSITLPLAQLLGSMKMPDIREIASSNGVYTYSSLKKIELISEICDHYNGRFFDNLFREMSLDEFLHFRNYALSGFDTKSVFDPYDVLPRICHTGLFYDTVKHGRYFAAELFEAYADWYGTDRESQLINEKYIITATDICSNLYSIFSFEQFKTILDVIKGSPDEHVTFEKTLNKILINRIVQWSERKQIFYNTRLFTEKYAIARWEEMLHGPGMNYVPSEEEAYRIAKWGLLFSRENHPEIVRILEAYQGYGYRMAGTAYQTLTEDLHCEQSDEILETHIRETHYSLFWGYNPSREDDYKNFMKMLTEERKRIPLVSLGGFSYENAPQELLDHKLLVDENKKEKDKKKNLTRKRSGRWW